MMEMKGKKSPTILLIIGASGSGKTTIAKALEKELSSDSVLVNYFDDIGVPSIDKMLEEHGSREKWQEWATHTWLEKLVKIKAQKFIILEGSFNPEFAVTKLKALSHTNYQLICLYAERVIRERRLREDRLQPELITQDMENFAQVLRTKTTELGGIILDTGQLSIHEVTRKIIQIIGESYDGFSI